jgi:hypothetical protein
LFCVQRLLFSGSISLLISALYFSISSGTWFNHLVLGTGRSMCHSFTFGSKAFGILVLQILSAWPNCNN